MQEINKDAIIQNLKDCARGNKKLSNSQIDAARVLLGKLLTPKRVSRGDTKRKRSKAERVLAKFGISIDATEGKTA